MTPIPLFEALQNEMHRKMGCSHLGCFNEAAAVHKKNTRPSTWPGGFYGFLCEGNARIDPDYIRMIGFLSKGLRNGSTKPAEAKGEGYLDMEEIQAAADYGNSIDDAKDLAKAVERYLTAPPAEKEALEQIMQHSLGFRDRESTQRCLDVLSRMKRGEFDTRTTRALFSGIVDAFRTGANGFNDEGLDGMVFPEELWRDPAGFEWDESPEHKSSRYGTRKDLGFSKKDDYR